MNRIFSVGLLLIAGMMASAVELFPNQDLVVDGITETKGGNKFISKMFELPETVDLTNQAISFTTLSETGENMGFFAIDIYNEGSEKPCIGFVSWSSPIPNEPKEFVLNPKQPKGQNPEWRVVGLDEEQPTKINRVNIILGTIDDAVRLNIVISDLKTVESGYNHSNAQLEYSDKPADVDHPFVMFTKADIEKARQNVAEHAWAKEVLNNSYARSKDLMTHDLDLIISGGDMFDCVYCPKCGKGEDAWGLSADRKSIQCRYCHVVFPSNELQETETMLVPVGNSGEMRELSYHLGDKDMMLGDDNLGNRYFLSSVLHIRQFVAMNFINHLAYIYAVTGDEAYAKRVREALLRFAEFYPNSLLKFRTYVYETPEFNYMAGKLGGWKYADSERIATMAIAYDMTADSGFYSDADKVKIENGIFREYVNMITAHRLNGDITTNAVPAHQTAVAICALLLDEKEIMEEYVLAGEGSFTEMVENMYLRDGVWFENTAAYSNMSNSPLVRLADVLNAYNTTLPEDNKLDTSKWKNLFASLGYQIMPDGFTPSINDSGWQVAYPAQFAEVTYNNFPTERNLALMLNNVDLTKGDEYALFKRDSKIAQPKESEFERFYSTSIVAGSNWVFLRPELSPKSTALVLDYGYVANGHSHTSNLNFLYYDKNRELVIDYGYMWWSHPLRLWQITPLAHNMVSVDGLLPDNSRQGELLMLGQSRYVQVAAAQGANAFADVTDNQRSMFLVSIDKDNHYMVDINRVRGGNEHLYTLHLEGENPLLPAGFKGENIVWGNSYFTGADYVQPAWSKTIDADSTEIFQWTKNNLTTKLYWTAQPDQLLRISKEPGNRDRSKPAQDIDNASFSSLVTGGESDFAGVISASDSVKSVKRLAVNGDGVAVEVTHNSGIDVVVVNYGNDDLTISEYANFRFKTGYSVARVGDNPLFIEFTDKINGKIVDILANKSNKIAVKLDRDIDISEVNYLFFNQHRDGACRIAEAEWLEDGVWSLTLDAYDDKFMGEGDAFVIYPRGDVKNK